MPLLFAMLIFMVPSGAAAVLAGRAIEKKHYTDAALWIWISAGMLMGAVGYQITTAIEAAS